MEISCNQCNQKYQLSEEKVDDRRVYFYCENCGHRIVIDRKKEGWFSFKPLKEELLSVTDLFDAVYLSFSKKNVLFTYMVLLLFCILGGIFALVVRGNDGFFGQHLFLSGFMLYFLTLALTLIFDLHLYLVSKNLVCRIEQGQSPRYSEFMPDLKIDFPSIFTVSIGLFLAFTILLFPLYLMKSHFSLVYGGFFSGILIILGFFFIISAYFRDILVGFIAMKPRSFRDTIRSLFKFTAVENLNIPLYSFFNALISGFLGLIVFVLAGSAAAIILWSATTFLAPGLAGGITDLSHIFTAAPEAADSVWSGMVFAIIFGSLVMLFVAAWFINLIQALAVTAVRIMSSNPGRSIHRGVLLTIMAVTVIAAVLAVL